jgi:GT2 family glycosyltransferase
LKKLSIIIVNYNVCYFLEQALTSVKKALQGIEGEVIVVDNNSVDGSVEMVRAKFPEVVLIDNKKNVGFSRANNQGIQIARGEYVLLLNPDTLVEEDTFVKCIDFMDARPDGGGLGIKMLDGKGNFLPESKRGLPSPWVAFYKIFGLAKLFPRSRRFGRYHLGFLDKEETHEIEILSGAYMFLRKSVLDKIGLLDEDYFMYGEDIDLSYRIIKAGYKNYYYPGTRIIHYKGESTKRTSINYVFIFYKAMIIFAGKHFSNKNAWIFSILINIAIYLRAGFAVGIRVLKQSLLPVTDAVMIFTGMYFLKSWWELNVKYVDSYYPPELVQIAFPIYIVVWLSSVFFSGGYDKPVRSFSIVRGVIAGTILISALSNFYDPYRFSKALILLGGIYSTIVLLLSRNILHFLKYRNFNLGTEKSKRIVIIGSGDESKRVMDLLADTSFNLRVMGYITPLHQKEKDSKNLGTIDQIQEIINIYRIDEVIFCSKDIAAHNIIEWMTRIGNKLVEFKIVPDESNYVIGSNSKDRPGEFYTLNIDLNIIHKSNLRNKRIFDIAMSFVILALSPALVWFAQQPRRFYSNIFNVMFGSYSWVGFTNSNHINLPKIKKGIIHPASYLDFNNMDNYTIDRLNMLYAKDYNLYMDFKLMVRSIRYLG